MHAGSLHFTRFPSSCMQDSLPFAGFPSSCRAFILQDFPSSLTHAGSLHLTGFPFMMQDPSPNRDPFVKQDLHIEGFLYQSPFILQGSLHHAYRVPSSYRVPFIKHAGSLHPTGFPSSCMQGPFILQDTLHHAGPSCYKVSFIMQDPSLYRATDIMQAFILQGSLRHAGSLRLIGFPSSNRVPFVMQVPFIWQGSLHHKGPSSHRVPFIMQDHHITCRAPSFYRVSFNNAGSFT
jgi:hypothetical protein